MLQKNRSQRSLQGNSTRIIVALMLATREQAETALAAQRQSRRAWDEPCKMDELFKRGEHSQRILYLCRFLSVLERPGLFCLQTYPYTHIYVIIFHINRF